MPVEPEILRQLQRIYVRPKLPHADKRDEPAQDARHDRSGEAVKDKGTPVHAPHSSHAGRVRLEINLRHAKAAALLLALDNHVDEQMEQRQYILPLQISPAFGLFHQQRQLLEGERGRVRSEEHTSELQSLMRRSYAVYRLKNKYTDTN